MGAIEIALLQQLKQQIQGISIPIEAKENISAYSKIYIDQDGKAVNSEAEYNNIVASHTSDFLLSESQTCRNWAWCKIDDTHYARVLRKPGELGHRVQILEFDFTNCSFSIISESSLLTINLNPPNSISDLQQAQIFKVDDGVLLVGLAYIENDGSFNHPGACVYKITYSSYYTINDITKIWSQDGYGTDRSNQGDRLWIFPYNSTYFLLYSADLSTDNFYMALKKINDGSEVSQVSINLIIWGDANLIFLNKPDVGKFYLYISNTLYVFVISNGTISLANSVSVELPSDWAASILNCPICAVADDVNNYLAIYCRHKNAGGTLLFSLADGTQNKANPTFESNLHYVEYDRYSKYELLAGSSFYIPFIQDFSAVPSNWYKVSLIKVVYDSENKKFNSQFICNVDVPTSKSEGEGWWWSPDVFYNIILAAENDIFVFSEHSVDNGEKCEKLVQVDIEDYFYSKGTCLVALSDINAGETGKAFAKKPVISAPDATAGVTYVENKYIATSTGYLVEIE